MSVKMALSYANTSGRSVLWLHTNILMKNTLDYFQGHTNRGIEFPHTFSQDKAVVLVVKNVISSSCSLNRDDLQCADLNVYRTGNSDS